MAKLSCASLRMGVLAAIRSMDWVVVEEKEGRVGDSEKYTRGILFALVHQEFDLVGSLGYWKA